VNKSRLDEQYFLLLGNSVMAGCLKSVVQTSTQLDPKPSCTRLRRRSAKTMRSFVWRIYRCRIGPGQPRARSMRRVKTSARSSGLNRAILDQGWGEFRRQLDYKLGWNGGMRLAVAPQNTRRTCPSCGRVAKENRQTRAQLRCVDCGDENNAMPALSVVEGGRSDQCFSAGIPRLSLWKAGATRPLAEAGTHRSESVRLVLNVVGISAL